MLDVARLNQDKSKSDGTSAVHQPPKQSNVTPSSVVAGVRSRLIRTPVYFISWILMFVATTLLLVALFTSNWQKTASYLIPKSHYEYFTYGLWFVCRRVNADWLYDHRDDVYCSTAKYSSMSWIYACQIFYTISAALNLFALSLGTLGICIDFIKSNVAVPSFLLWALMASCIGQIIMYGGAGIGNYSNYEPAYSLIIACIALGFNFVSAILYLVEIFVYLKVKRKR